MSDVVVIGAGQAGASLVTRLRMQGHQGRITLIGDEPVPPYQRPPLSKAYLLGEMEEARLYLRPEATYAEAAIDLRIGSPVTGIDLKARTVTSGGTDFPFDHLAFCTGSTPRRLPASIGGDLDGVFTVRTLADVDQMAPCFKDGARALIVGGGYIGLEAAAVAAKLGLKVTLVEMAERILNRVACRETADWFRDLHRAHGVEIREGIGLNRLLGDGRVQGAALSDGSELPVDLVIAGIGIVPETTLAEAAGVTCDNGIRTDVYGQTSAKGVWAAGDCASFPGQNGLMRLESVGNAIDMAEIVADNIMGASAPYHPRPWFWSDQYDVKLQIAGLGTGHDHIAIREADGARSHWYFGAGRLLAIDAMNDPRGYMVGKRLIEAGLSPEPSAVSDPATDLKVLMKSMMRG